MNFKEMLLLAQRGDSTMCEQILEMYKPLLLKESIVYGVFDEDIYQELSLTLLRCIRSFRIE